MSQSGCSKMFLSLCERDAMSYRFIASLTQFLHDIWKSLQGRCEWQSRHMQSLHFVCKQARLRRSQVNVHQLVNLKERLIFIFIAHNGNIINLCSLTVKTTRFIRFFFKLCSFRFWKRKKEHVVFPLYRFVSPRLYIFPSLRLQLRIMKNMI